MEKGKYVLNIRNGTIHNTERYCFAAKNMIEKNKKWFNSYDEALNFYEGKSLAEPCGICLKEICH